MPKKQRQHTVPSSYLERFADQRGRVTVASRRDFASRFTTSIDNVTVESYFYSMATEEGWDPVIEDQMGNDVEGQAKIDIGKLLERRPSTLPAFRRRLARFLALQYIRGRSEREARVAFVKACYRKTAELATPEMVKAELERLGEECSIEEARSIAAIGKLPNLKVGFQPVGDRSLPADSLTHVQDIFPEAERLIPCFSERGWVVMHFEEPCLLTSDEPVAIASDDAPGQLMGLSQASTVVFPLDPRHGLVMVHRDSKGADHAWQAGTPAQAKVINEHVAYKAHLQIIFHPDTDPLAGMVLPEKAPPTYVVGDQVMMGHHQSVESRKEIIRRLTRLSS